MLVPKVQNLVLVVVVMLAVIVLLAFLIIDPNRVTAQAQNELSYLTVSNYQKVGNSLTYQEVYTNSNSPNFPTGAEPQSGQLRVVTNLQSATSGSGVAPQSINSGFEYIPSSAFRSDGLSPASEYRFVPTTGYIRNNSASSMCLAAPVYAPKGATLTRFSMFFVDNNAANDLTNVKLWRKNQSPAGAGSAAQEVASLSFPGVNQTNILEGFVAPSPGLETVNNSFGYYIGFCFNGGTGLEQRVYGFRVAYNP
jgi:hypothetical protein